MMKKLLVILSTAVLLTCLLVLGCSAEGAGEPSLSSPYGLYVAGIAVTEANCSDILGDGTAVFDPTTYTLSLDGMDKESFTATSFDREGRTVSLKLSVLFNKPEKELTLNITGKCKFYGGIVVSGKGNIQAQDADITFENGASCLIDCPKGKAEFRDCKINIKGADGFDYIRGTDSSANAMYLNAILFEKTKVYFSYRNPTTNYIDGGLISALTRIYILDSDFDIFTPFPMFATAITCQGEEIVVSDSRINMGGLEHAIMCAGGNVEIHNSTLRVNHTNDLIYATTVTISKSDVYGYVYYNGIICGTDDPTQMSLISDSRVKLERLSFKNMKRHVLRDYYSAMADTSSYGSLSAFFEDIKTRLYEPCTACTLGLSMNNGTLSVVDSRIQMKDFHIGIMAYGESYMGLYGRVNIRIRDSKVPLVLLTTVKNSFKDESNSSSSGGALVATPVPAGLATTVGYKYLVTYSGTELQFTTDRASSPIEVIFAATGYTTSLSLRSPLPTWVYVTVLAVAVALIILVVFLVMKNLRGMSTDKLNNKKNNTTPAPATEKDDPEVGSTDVTTVEDIAPISEEQPGNDQSHE